MAVFSINCPPGEGYVVKKGKILDQNIRVNVGGINPPDAWGIPCRSQIRTIILNPIINILHKNNLIKNNHPNSQTIESLGFNGIEKIAAEIESIIISEIEPAKPETLTHTASSGLGGGLRGCHALDCRLKNVNHLARFALMYSDKIYIESYFTKYVDADLWDLEELKETFYNDIMLIIELNPLINHDFIDFYCPDTVTCFTCQAKTYLGKSAGKKFLKSYRTIQKQYLENMSVGAAIDYDELEFFINGPEPFFDHSYSSPQFDIPLALKKRPSILKKIESGKEVRFSKTLIKDLGYHKNYAHELVSDAMSGLAASRLYNNVFLSDNSLHFDFINSMQPVREIAERNKIAEKYLTSIVPFINDVKLEDILKIRKREQESFLIYRKVLNEAIQAFSSGSNVRNENDAKNLYSDMIAPSIAQLDLKVRQAKKDLIIKSYRPVIGIVGVISFGMLAGLFPSNTFEIIKALGLFKFGSDFLTNLMAIGDTEKEIKMDQFYFLWRIKKSIDMK